MGFSRTEVLDLLAPRTEEQIELALLELGFDIDEVDYPTDIVEQVEKTFGVIDKAVKQLSGGKGSKKSEALVTRQATEITRQELAALNIEIPAESLFYLVQGAVIESQKAAALISEVAKTAFITEFHNQQQDFFQEVAASFHSGAQRINEVFSDEVITKIVTDTVGKPKQFDVDSFLEEQRKIKEQNEKLRTRTSIKPVEVDKPFDIDGFLADMNKKMNGGK